MNPIRTHLSAAAGETVLWLKARRHWFLAVAIGIGAGFALGYVV